MNNPQSRRVVTIHDEREAARHARGRVVLIDDDDAIREALATIVTLEGYAVDPFQSATKYLEYAQQSLPLFPGPQCILLDVKMPELTGLELQRRLKELNVSIPLVFMSGGSGALEATQALKNGAVDFLIKPFDEESLLTAIRTALLKNQSEQQNQQLHVNVASRLGSLTARERQIAKLVSCGMLNRDIAEKLGIAIRTVKLHRMHMMRKVGAANVIELSRLVEQLD
jgi:FixJ family two-component response regulator